MGKLIKIHEKTPQAHLIRQAVAILKQGGVIIYPTDSGYALGCHLGDKDAVQRIRKIKRLSDKHYLTLICRDLSEIATYALVDNTTYRILKAYTPGPYTFLLNATREVPRRLMHPKRKTIGIRVPDNVIALTLLDALEEPMISSTLILPDAERPLIEPEAMYDMLGKQVNLVIDGGYCGIEPTTVIDLTEDMPKIVRHGKGDVSPFI